MTKPRLRIGLIGTGFMGRMHSQQFSRIREILGGRHAVDDLERFGGHVRLFAVAK